LLIGVFLGKFLGFGDVFGLAGFITPRQQQHDLCATAGEIDPVTGANVPASFRNPTADAFHIAPVPGGHLAKAKNDGGFGAVVFQTTQPAAENGGFGKTEWVDCICLDTFGVKNQSSICAISQVAKC
jgi:hypothetical protein